MAERRNRIPALVIGAACAAVTWLLLIAAYTTLSRLSPTFPSVAGHGCLENDREKTVEVGEVAIVEASIRYRECASPTASANPEAPHSTQSEQPVRLAAKARVQLISPLFTGDIQPISEEVLPIGPEYDSGHWSWEVRPTRPGDQHISMVLTVYDQDGETIEGQGRRIDVAIHAKSTFAYHADSLWNGLQSFITSAVGAITGVATVVGLLATTVTRFRRHQDPPAPPTSGRDDGYL